MINHTQQYGSSNITDGISQDDREIVQIGDRGIAPKASWLNHIIRNLPLVYEKDGIWLPIPRKYRIPALNKDKEFLGYEELEPIALDQGNGFIKASGQGLNNKLISVVIPSRIEIVEDQTIFGNRDQTVWRVGTTTKVSPTKYRVGKDAKGKKARGFTVGDTATRFQDSLYPCMLQIAIVQLLKKIGYTGGTHHLALGFAIRIPEISIDTSGRQIVDANVTSAARTHLKTAFVVEETQNGETISWNIEIHKIYPTTQSTGSFFLWNYNLLCDPAQEKFRSVNILDLGTGDMGLINATITPGENLVIDGHIVSEGAITFANAVNEAIGKHFPGSRYTVAKAQQAIISNELILGGQAHPLIQPEDLLLEEDNPYDGEINDDADEETDISPTYTIPIAATRHDASYNINDSIKVGHIRQSNKNAISQFMVNADPTLRDQGSFLIITGGTLKNRLVASKLERSLRTLQRTTTDSLMMPLDADLAILGNSQGTYVYTCWQLNRAKK